MLERSPKSCLVISWCLPMATSRLPCVPSLTTTVRTFNRAKAQQRRDYKLRRLFFITSFAAAILIAPAFGAEAPVKKDPVPTSNMTIAECIGVLIGLQQLDAGYTYIVAQGKPSESVQTIKFKLPTKVRDAISHDLFVLGSVQQEAQANNRRVQLEIIGDKPDPIKPGSKEELIFNDRMFEYTGRPCTAQLDHIFKADLDLEHNDISGSVQSLLTKIIDK